MINIKKLNTALDETEKQNQYIADMEKQLDEVVQKRYIIRMLGDLPLYHVGFGILVNGANPEFNEPLIKLSDLMNAVAELPTVEAEPVKHGKWLKDPHSQNGFPSHIYMMRKCSECGHSVDNPTPYCPWCGARMDAERKEE